MLRIIGFALLIMLLYSACCLAQVQALATGPVTWTGETEFTQDQHGNQAYDVYAFANYKKWSVFGRMLRVENSVHRGEFGVGYALSFLRDKIGNPSLVVIPSPGVTTDGAGLFAVVAILNTRHRTITYVPDAKFYPDRRPNTLYQEISAGLTRRGGWQARWERLQVGGIVAYNRFGIERRFWVRDWGTGVNSHFHISPFINTETREFGFYTGFRWQ